MRLQTIRTIAAELCGTLLLSIFVSSALVLACDAEGLAVQVDRLQAENDALRAAARLRIIAPPDAPAPDGVAFREASKPWQKCLPTAETQDTITDMMKACGAKPITISASGYDPDASTSDEQVLSLGYSYMGDAKARACIDAEMDARGAVSL